VFARKTAVIALRVAVLRVVVAVLACMPHGIERDAPRIEGHACGLALHGAISCAMAPRTRPNPQSVRPSPEDEADIRAGLAELDRGEGVELTPGELRQWAETGEWPERLD
jgi:hypothetical protein